MAYTLRPTNLGMEKDYLFCVDGVACGRTYEDLRPRGAIVWTWSIYGIRLRGTIPEGVSVQGTELTLELAGEAFKRNWERLVEAGIVKG